MIWMFVLWDRSIRFKKVLKEGRKGGREEGGEG